jgi:hypothetical protein
MQVRGIGMMECWNTGVGNIRITPSFQCSNIPLLQYSYVATSSYHFAQDLIRNCLIWFPFRPASTMPVAAG